MSDSLAEREDRPWLAVRVEPSADPQAVVDALFAAGSLGVQEDGAAIVTHFPPGTSASAIEAVVHERDPAARVTTGPAPAMDWSAWRASVGAHQLGDITIAPPWLAGESRGGLEVVIDPAMAFGTGEHATTRGVVRLMQRLPRMPDVVADLGAGSAVLSICAAKLGAKRIAAIELDPDAIGNAEENVAANSAAESVRVLEGDAAVLLPLVSPVGLVLANIISSILLELLPLIRDSLVAGGHAILSGILVDERPMMVDAIASEGFEIVAEDTEEGWWSVLIERAL
ncbi:MAG: 50S ribosomal protein L11 methyltransferase [Gemmatimonadaceae bacterium]|nr:50S ribosomal protein L11 methyltransferase [Gemmatimonadaceae bacterium]